MLLRSPTLIAVLTLLPCVALASAKDAPTASQQQAFDRLQQRYAGAQAVWQPTLAGPQMVTGLAATPAGRDDAARAQAFLGEWRTLFGVTAAMLAHQETQRTRLRSVARFGQVFEGLEVLDRQVALTFDHGGTLLTVASDAVAISRLQRGDLTREQAISRAVQVAIRDSRSPSAGATPTSARQVVFAGYGGARHAWVVRVVRTAGHVHLRLVIDAATGSVLQIRNMVRHG